MAENPETVNAISLPQNPRFLLVRTDKIGDVLLTTPALTSLRIKYPESFIAFLCNSYSAPILENNPAINLILKSDENSLFELAQKIRALKFDAAIHFYVENKTALATWMAKVPIRIGPFSKLLAGLLTERISQNRSRVEKHEAEYNLDLVKVCGADGSSSVPILILTDAEKKRGREIIASLKIAPHRLPVIIHPGSAGSVQNWPLEHFLKLAERISGEQGYVILTAGKGEEWISDKVKNNFQTNESRINIIPAGSLTLRELAAVISQSMLMISNSTGPLHMAVALGIPTLSFYPHIPKVTSAVRWGPFGETHLHRVLSPDSVSLPMSSISVETAFQSVNGILKKS